MITETSEIRALARDFALAELRPNVERWDHDRALDEGLLRQVAEMGFFGMLVPEAHGGMSLDVPTYLAALEELAWGEASVALTVASSTFVMRVLLQHGTDEQKTRWLEKLAAGEMLGCFALADHVDAFEPADKALHATRSADGWVLDGTKRWVTNGRIAQLALVSAHSGGGDGAQAEGLFLVPTDTQGYEIVSRETTMGLRALEVLTIRFNQVRVGPEAAVAQARDGVTALSDARDIGRLGVAAQSVGIAQAAIEHALAYADQREQFGQKLRQFEGIQFKLADMSIRTESARALLNHAAHHRSHGTSSSAKVCASEAAMWVTTQAVQIFGGYGYMRDYPVEKLMRDAKAMELLESPNEILRAIIAGELYH